MTTHSFSFTFLVTTEKAQPLVGDLLEHLSDELMHAMLETETDLAFDSSVGAILTTGEVDVSLTVATDHETDAAAIARDFVIQAIRATGGTPMGVFVFPPARPRTTPRQEWHERRAELTNA